MVLMVGHLLIMPMSMDQGLRMLEPMLLRMLMRLQDMRRQPEKVRQHGSGKEEKSRGESASRHTGIVPHPVRKVKPSSSGLAASHGGYGVLMRM
jgi:hypothetical protein